MQVGQVHAPLAHFCLECHYQVAVAIGIRIVECVVQGEVGSPLFEDDLVVVYDVFALESHALTSLHLFSRSRDEHRSHRYDSLFVHPLGRNLSVDNHGNLPSLHLHGCRCREKLFCRERFQLTATRIE